MDTSGSSEFPAMRSLAIEKAQVVLIVFSVDDRQSYERVTQYRDEVIELKTDEVRKKMGLFQQSLQQKRRPFLNRI